MDKLDPGQLETLRFIHQSQREESLDHRKTIHSAFGFSIAGLAATLAGIIAANDIAPGRKWVILLAIVGLCASNIAFMAQQRQESEAGLEIVRRIERRLGLYESGTYFDGESVLPYSFQQSKIDEYGFNPGDRLQVACLLIVSCLIAVVLYFS